MKNLQIIYKQTKMMLLVLILIFSITRSIGQSIKPIETEFIDDFQQFDKNKKNILDLGFAKSTYNFDQPAVNKNLFFALDAHYKYSKFKNNSIKLGTVSIPLIVAGILLVQRGKRTAKNEHGGIATVFNKVYGITLLVGGALDFMAGTISLGKAIKYKKKRNQLLSNVNRSFQ